MVEQKAFVWESLPHAEATNSGLRWKMKITERYCRSHEREERALRKKQRQRRFQEVNAKRKLKRYEQQGRRCLQRRKVAV